MSKKLQDMTDAEILEFTVELSEADYDNLDEESKAIVDRVIAENSAEESKSEETPEGEVEASTEELDEAAKDTLKPHGAPGDSKSLILGNFMQMLSQLGKEDLSHIYTRTLEQIGKEASVLPAKANASSNQATIAAKKTVKEDIDDMFSDDTLSEDLKERATVVFEAAVNTRSLLKDAELQEAHDAKVVELEAVYETKLEEASKTMFEELSTKIDQYLDYVVEQWLEDNKQPIETTLRAEIAEDFIKGLHGLFAEHYIKVPEDSLDIVAELKPQNDDLNARLNETLDRTIELEAITNEATAESVFDTVSEGLVETEVEKLRTLSEGIEFTDVETYEKKLKIIKENYFKGKTAATDTGIINESIDGSTGTAEEETVQIDPRMAAYLAAMNPKAKS